MFFVVLRCAQTQSAIWWSFTFAFSMFLMLFSVCNSALRWSSFLPKSISATQTHFFLHKTDEKEYEHKLHLHISHKSLRTKFEKNRRRALRQSNVKLEFLCILCICHRQKEKIISIHRCASNFCLLFLFHPTHTRNRMCHHVRARCTKSKRNTEKDW